MCVCECVLVRAHSRIQSVTPSLSNPSQVQKKKNEFVELARDVERRFKAAGGFNFEHKQWNVNCWAVPIPGGASFTKYTISKHG